MTQRFTLAEAAAQLMAPSTRWLADWLRAHPRDKSGEPYYTPVGRDKVFRSDDIARIEFALREGLKCHSSSGRRGQARRRITRSGAPTEVQKDHSAWRQAAELLNDPTLLSSCGPSRTASTSTDAGQRRPSLSLIKGSLPS